jgi:hypothetical protein
VLQQQQQQQQQYSITMSLRRPPTRIELKTDDIDGASAMINASKAWQHQQQSSSKAAAATSYIQ